MTHVSRGASCLTMACSVSRAISQLAARSQALIALLKWKMLVSTCHTAPPTALEDAAAAANSRTRIQFSSNLPAASSVRIRRKSLRDSSLGLFGLLHSGKSLDHDSKARLQQGSSAFAIRARAERACVAARGWARQCLGTGPGTATCSFKPSAWTHVFLFWSSWLASCQNSLHGLKSVGHGLQR